MAERWWEDSPAKTTNVGMAAKTSAWLCGKPPCEHNAIALNPAPSSQVSCMQCQGFLCLPKRCITARRRKRKPLQLMLKKWGWSWKSFRVEAKNPACSWIWSFSVICLKCSVLKFLKSDSFERVCLKHAQRGAGEMAPSVKCVQAWVLECEDPAHT